LASRLLQPSVDRARLERLVLWALVVVLLLPLAVTAIRVLAHGDLNPGGDRALIELRVRDIGSHTPLLGSYGRYGFNQPGPLWFFVLAVPYRLLGSHYSGLQLAAVLVSAAAVVQILFISRRRGGLVPLLWTGLLLAILIHGLGPLWIADPWEPRGLTLVCAALVFLAFDAAAGRLAALPIVAVAATLLAQAQAGLVAFAVAMFAVAAGGIVFRAVRSTRDPDGGDDQQFRARAIRTTLLTAGVLVLLWIPPLVALARHDAGNLADMWRSLRSPSETLGLGDAWRSVAQQLEFRAPWLGFHEKLLPFDITLDLRSVLLVPVALLLLIAAMVFAWRRRDGAVILGGTVVIAVLAAVVSLDRLLGPLFFWIPEWTRALGMACWVAAGWCAYRAFGDRARARIDQLAVPLLSVALAIFVVMSTADAVRTRTATDPTVDAVHRLAADVLPRVRDADGPTLVTATIDQSQLLGSDPGLPTLVLDLERAGVPTRVDTPLSDHFGPDRARPDQARAELRLITDADEIPPGFEVLATEDPLTPQQRAERARLLAALPGLGPNPSTSEIFDVLAAHPELRPIGQQLAALPALPVLSVIGRPLLQ
jgi:hypothetical protein